MKFLSSFFALFLSTVGAHRSLPPGITCGPQFSAENPLVIPNPKISWANYHIYTCEHPIMWYEATLDAGQDALFTVLVPELERFREARMSVVFLHESLPPLADQTDVVIPESILDYAVANNLGGMVYQSPDDQSTCDHLTSDIMINAVTVKDGRCHFYETFGGSNMWAIMDEGLQAPVDGTYKIAIFEEHGMEVKASLACCDFPEDFVTQFNIPDTECPACGSNSLDNPAWTQLFFETDSMIEFGGFPAGNVCTDGTDVMISSTGAATSTTTEYPTGDMCPPVIDPNDIPFQPASCALGCNKEGECHSHNVFGECNHQLEWELVPKFGNAEVKNIVIFKGDTITFRGMPGSALAHNLFEITDETNLDQCNFAGSNPLANVEDIAIGHEISFDQAGTFYFTCSIGCVADINNLDGNTDLDIGLCHCEIGQKLTVEVKDISDGLRCHSHEQILHSHTNTTQYTAMECPEGTVMARTINNPVYGAVGDRCAQYCTPEIALSFAGPSVERGLCSEMGYTTAPTEQTITPPGSPFPIDVVVLEKEPEPAGDCHCHSYEQIVCPEEETAEDTLYIEHIEEIETYCTGILDGSEDDCPYKCFQPIEVLHLHYLECPTRVVDPTYIAVNATNKCHIAATAPDTIHECPEVVLGQSPTEGDVNTADQQDDQTDDADDSDLDENNDGDSNPDSASSSIAATTSIIFVFVAVASLLM